VLIACWSAKGGSGTTVVAAALALLTEGRGDGPVVVADLAGDMPAVFGIPDPAGPGIGDWLAAGRDVPAGSLPDITVAVAPGVALLPSGRLDAAAVDEACAERLAVALGSLGVVVVDCGVLDTRPLSTVVAQRATHSLLVIRPCYLALRRALAVPLRPSGIVLLAEEGRSLGRVDVEQVLGAPVRAEVPVDSRIARAVDAGLLARSVPSPLARALRRAA
jgi:MinD-like ATPase involved in chromosome partitioning or flagellar assembly